MWTSLIGFMGSGKSTLTRRLQVSTRRPLVSLDDEVVGRAGKDIPAIFQDGGEASFRAHELEALKSLDPDRNLVVDTGGGIVHTPEACALLQTRGVVLWLDVPWDVLLRRLRQADPDSRPSSAGWAGRVWKSCTAAAGPSTRQPQTSGSEGTHWKPTTWPARPCCAAWCGSVTGKVSDDESHRRPVARTSPAGASW
jgi:shikimate kinase